MVLTWRNWYPWLTAWNAASPIACEDGRKTVKLESNRYIPLEVVHQRRLKHLYATRLTFTDHWSFDLSVSDLGSVAWMEKECSQQRYKSRGNTTDQLNERIEWQTFFSCITCSCRHDALSVGDQSSNPIFVCELWNIQCSDLLSKRPDKITQVVMLFPDWFRFPSCYRSNSTVFGPPTWSLNFDGCEMSRTSVAMLIYWCPRMTLALRYLQLFQPWTCRAVVEVVYSVMILAQSPWSFSWRYGWAGLQFPQKSGKFYFSGARKFNCDLLPRWLPAFSFWPSAFHWPWHFECSFSWKVFRCRIIDNIWQGLVPANDR